MDAGLLTNDQLQQALAGQRGSGLKLGQYLVREGVIREDQVIDQISQQLKIEKYDSQKYPIDQTLADLIPFAMAQKHEIVPLRKKMRLLTVAMADPMDINAVDAAEVLTNMEVMPVVCSEKEINQLITLTYGTQVGGLKQVLEGVEEAPVAFQKETADDVDVQVRRPPSSGS